MKLNRNNNELALAACLLITIAITGATSCTNNLSPSDYKVIGLERYGADGKTNATWESDGLSRLLLLM